MDCGELKVSDDSRLFNFSFAPLGEVTPWGDSRTIHWYALTEGSYWVSVGDQELLRYSDEIIAYWRGHGHPNFGIHESYYVMQFWDDLSTVLPFALESVPADIISELPFVDAARASHIPRQAQVVPADIVLRLSAPDEPAASERARLCYDATEWWRARRVPIMHLTHNPDIHIWREEQVVSISWENSRCECEGIHVWAAREGEFKLSLERFQSEVADFEARFIREMVTRVNEVCARPPLGTSVDVDAIRETQREVERAIGGRTPIATTDWTAVREALAKLRGTLN